MTQLEKALKVKDAANHILNGIMSGCIQMSVAAVNAYRDLVDQFCQDNRDFISAQQHEDVKSDYEYFFRLIDLAVAYWQRRAHHEHS
jgi:hypothetical protein